MKKKVIVFWTGGKDCAYVLHVLQNSDEYDVVGLFSITGKKRNLQHGILQELLQEQADQLGLPLFRYSYSGRGRIIFDPASGHLKLVGFFTWPSLLFPILIFLTSLFLPFADLFIYLLLVPLFYTQRNLYQFVAAVVKEEFTQDEPVDIA